MAENAEAPAGRCELRREGDRVVVEAVGAWTIGSVPTLDPELRRLEQDGLRGVEFRLGRLDALDTAGAWLIARTQFALEAAGIEAAVSEAKPGHAALLKRVVEAGPPPALPPAPRFNIVDVVAGLGEAVFDAARQARHLLGFFGAILVAVVRVLAHPGRIRFVSFVSHMEQHGLNAMPIIGLLTFLVGSVLAYQGYEQLRQFGAEVYTADLVGIGVLREMGVLITAIIVAGRSGSAFTAQIGTMQVNEEVDALRTLGLDPLEVLVLPRLFALMIALPLLTFFADVMGTLGGAVIAWLVIDIPIPQFLRRLNEAVTLTHFWVGMVKAPVFAFVIAMVGCFEGMRVRGSAESVGRLTTQAVVEAIFLVIVIDAVFANVFTFLGI